MRLFLAIFPPKEYLTYFRDVLRMYNKVKRNLKPIPMEQIHLTLKFIGANVSEHSKDEIFATLKKFEGEFPKPTISIDKMQFGFNYQKFPKVLMGNIEEDQGLEDLADVVHQKIRELYLSDTIRWKMKHANDFHISVARLKDTATNSSGKFVGNITKDLKLTPPAPFQPEEMVFMESILTPQGTVYKRLEGIKL